MFLRPYRPGDAAGVEQLWERNPSAEFPVLGLDPREVRNILRRTEKWNIRFLLALASAVGRPLFRLLITEEEGRVVGTAMITFPPNVGYISGLTVDAAFRRKGYALALLKECERLGRQFRRACLTLDVLTENWPAIRLYEKLGYRTFRDVRWMTRDLSVPVGSLPSDLSYTIQAFRPATARRLSELANNEVPPSHRPMVSVRSQDLRLSRLGQRIGRNESASWVVERERRIVGFAKATISPAVQAAQIEPLVLIGPLDTEAWTGLINTALSWCVARKSPRAILSLPEHLDKALPVLQSEGFTEGLRLHTMALDLGAK